MQIATFELERYFARHEFTARYLLSSSDCEALLMSELLGMADPKMNQMWEELKLGYTESPGHPLLRDEIAELYQEIQQDDVLVVVPEEGIFLLMHALLQPGDQMVCTFPGYQSLYEVARSIGCQVSTWKPDEGRDWRFDIEDLAQKIQNNTKLVVVNFPHNPTGYVPSQADYQAIIELVKERGVYLLSDEMYRFLEVDEGVTLPPACDLYERACSLFGLSKTFGLPGLRIGWLASQDGEILKQVSLLKDYTTICSSAPSEILAIIALRNRNKIIAGQNRRVHRNIGLLDAFFQDYQDIFHWHRPQGGSICFPRVLAVENTYDFCEQLVQEESILLAPSRAFQFGEHHVRIGFGRENLPQVLPRLAQYLDQRFR
ncbi:MAG: aminotransferase class I/II-fold pyridoxal phosphate-dependent enzyme [Anaerolineales bacterium]|jgi:aspartate/methionine/tyrosine aminotransferase